MMIFIEEGNPGRETINLDNLKLKYVVEKFVSTSSVLAMDHKM